MNIGMELGVIIAYAVGLIALYIIGWVLIIPMRHIGKMLVKGAIGFLMLFIVNFIGKAIGIAVIINPFTAMVAGILGIPGVVLLVAINSL